MTFQLRIDKNSFQFHIIFLGMNPIKDVFAARHNPSDLLWSFFQSYDFTSREAPWDLP